MSTRNIYVEGVPRSEFDQAVEDLQEQIDAVDGADLAPVYTAIQVVQDDVDAHELRTDNPHSVTKSQVGLSNVNNTSDSAKPVSTAQQTALDLKVDKISGKGLSTEDYTTTEKTKLSGIASGATANSSDATLLARSNHTGTQSVSTISGLGDSATKNTGLGSSDVAAGNQAMPGKSILTSTSLIANTGSTTENFVLSSANLVGFIEANDQFYISLMYTATGNANQKTLRFYISDSNTSLVNQQQIGLMIVTSGATTPQLCQKAIWLRGSLSSANNVMFQAASSGSFAAGAVSNITVNLSTGTKYIVMTMQNAVSGDSFSVLSLWGTQFRP